MTMFNVPQFIDVEDKIVGPLTAKQLGWLAVGAVMLMIFWFTLDFSAFILVAVIVGGLFGSLAFYKPNGQPMIAFVLSLFSFSFKPKMYVWRRTPDMKKTFETKIQKSDTIKTSPQKTLTKKKVEELSQILDKKY